MLISSTDVSSLRVVTGSRQSPHPKYYVGEDRAQEIAQVVRLSLMLLFLIVLYRQPKNVILNLYASAECLIERDVYFRYFCPEGHTHKGKLQV